MHGKSSYMGKLRPEHKPEKPIPAEKIKLDYDQNLFELLRAKRN